MLLETILIIIGWVIAIVTTSVSGDDHKPTMITQDHADHMASFDLSEAEWEALVAFAAARRRRRAAVEDLGPKCATKRS